MDVKNDVTLNRDQLDKEWERQPLLIEEYSTESARLQQVYADAKIDLDAKISERKLQYRTGKLDAGVKITEGALNELINADAKTIEAQKNLNQLKYECDVAKGVVESLRNKKSALEYEVQLFMVGYFGEPKNQQKAGFKNLQESRNKN